MAQQDQLHKTFRLEGKAPRFPKRKGIHSLQNCYKIFKREYLDLDHKLKTKARKEKVTRELSYSVVGAPLANVPLDVITLAKMHVILGMTKKMYDWL